MRAVKANLVKYEEAPKLEDRKNFFKKLIITLDDTRYTQPIK